MNTAKVLSGLFSMGMVFVNACFFVCFAMRKRTENVESDKTPPTALEHIGEISTKFDLTWLFSIKPNYVMNVAGGAMRDNKGPDRMQPRACKT